ncbi:hypothetical protein LHFGNBLO_002222 [Mesorhizobium sp. AR10]|uniref:hypothetical protein n=1 Tax=Mesorhizobium sp. AR10 TaxID=2865839 RepID=UPI00215E4696|nr:hypothetical protein [Mesorhizobium sp. AR10]UVK40714.1 hypothetical protein LHFGNBLO_002222 [Mesorhizobium sp. AR10]
MHMFSIDVNHPQVWVDNLFVQSSYWGMLLDKAASGVAATRKRPAIAPPVIDFTVKPIGATGEI